MKKSNNYIYIIGAIILILIIIFAIIPVINNNNSIETKSNYIKIGVVTPLSGDCALYGENAKNANSIAVNEINSNGGILGKKLQLIYQDGKCTSQGGLSAAQKLVNIDNVKIILGGVSSSETLGLAPFTEKNKILVFSSGASSPDISDAGIYIFRNYPSESILGSETAKLIYKDGFRNIGILVENTDYPVSIQKVFTNEFKSLGGNIAVVQNYNSDSKDFKSELTKIKNTNIDAILFLPQTGLSGGLAAKQAYELDINVPYYGDAQFGGTQALETAGVAANNLKFVDAPIVQSTKGKKFLDKYNNLYGKPVMNYFVSAEYDGVYLVRDAIQACNGDQNTDCLRDYFYNLPDYNGTIGNYKFNSKGDVEGIKFTVKQIIDAKNGKINIIN